MYSKATDPMHYPFQAHRPRLTKGGCILCNRLYNVYCWQAPDVSYIDGTYYLYYSMSKFGTQESAIGYATSKTMDVGSWTDHPAPVITSVVGSPYNAIDANYINVNGTHYLNFGSFWRDIYQAKMSSPSQPSGGPYQISYNARETAMEGAFMFKHGGHYYLFYSKGSCCGFDKKRPARGAEYKIMVCRSTSVTGGFVDQSGQSCTNGGGTVVLESHDYVYGPGGQGVIQDRKHGPVLYYHYGKGSSVLLSGVLAYVWRLVLTVVYDVAVCTF